MRVLQSRSEAERAYIQGAVNEYIIGRVSVLDEIRSLPLGAYKDNVAREIAAFLLTLPQRPPAGADDDWPVYAYHDAVFALPRDGTTCRAIDGVASGELACGIMLSYSWVRRQMIADYVQAERVDALKAMAEAVAHGTDQETARAECDKRLAELSALSGTVSTGPDFDLLRQEQCEDLIRDLFDEGGVQAHIETPFEFFNHHVPLVEGCYTVFASPPKRGKTRLAYRIAIRAAQHGHPVYIASLDTDWRTSLYWLVGMDGCVDPSPIFHGDASAQHRQRFATAIHEFVNLPIRLNAAPRMGARAVVDEARAFFDHHEKQERIKQGPGYVRRHGLMIVDHIGKLDPPEKVDDDNKALELCSDVLRTAFRNLKVSGIVLAHLTKEAANSGRRPQIGHIRYGSSVSFDASAVVFLWGRLNEQGEPTGLTQLTAIGRTVNGDPQCEIKESTAVCGPEQVSVENGW